MNAERYARSLWCVLDLVCTRGSIDYTIVPALRRAEALDDPTVLTPFDSSGAAWWRVVAPTPVST